jgi:hypothetical protein
MPFFETSAKTGHNVEEAFHELVRQMPRYGIDYKVRILTESRAIAIAFCLGGKTPLHVTRIWWPLVGPFRWSLPSGTSWRWSITSSNQCRPEIEFRISDVKIAVMNMDSGLVMTRLSFLTDTIVIFIFPACYPWFRWRWQVGHHLSVCLQHICWSIRPYYWRFVQEAGRRWRHT